MHATIQRAHIIRNRHRQVQKARKQHVRLVLRLLPLLLLARSRIQIPGRRMQILHRAVRVPSWWQHRRVGELRAALNLDVRHHRRMQERLPAPPPRWAHHVHVPSPTSPRIARTTRAATSR